MGGSGESFSSGVLLEDLTWQEAERALTAERVVAIPLGAAAKEHGPHLKLNNDWLIAEYLKRRVAAAVDVVVAPTVPYSYYPAFAEYPGSVTLSRTTAQAVIEEICRSLSSFGPRRFYVINTGISTLEPLEAAARALAPSGIVLRYTDLAAALAPAESRVLEQEGGTHADEGETSMVLYIAADRVDMGKAVKDFQPGKGRLTRRAGADGVYSPSGVWGDPTLASRDKGRILVEALVEAVIADIARLAAESL